MSNTNTFPDGFPQTPLEAIEFSYFLEDKQEWYDWLNSANAEEQSELVSILHNMWIEEQANVVPETLSAPAMPIFVPETTVQPEVFVAPELPAMPNLNSNFGDTTNFVAPELPQMPVMPSFEFKAPEVQASFVAPELPAMPNLNSNFGDTTNFVAPSFEQISQPTFEPIQIAKESVEEGVEENTEAVEIPSFDANPVFEKTNDFTPISQEAEKVEEDFVFDDFEEDKELDQEITQTVTEEVAQEIVEETVVDPEIVQDSVTEEAVEEDDYIDFNFDEEDEEIYSNDEIGTIATVDADKFATDLEKVENNNFEEQIAETVIEEVVPEAIQESMSIPVIVPRVIPDYDADIDTVLANNFNQIQQLETPTELDHSIFSTLLSDYNTQVATQNQTFVKVLEAMYEQQQTFIGAIEKKQNEAVAILNSSIGNVQGLSNNIQALYAKVEELEQKLMDINSVVIGHTQNHTAQERTNIDVQDQVADLQYSMDKSSQSIQSLRARTNDELKKIHQQVAGDKADIYRQDGGEVKKALDVLTKQVAMLRSQRPTPPANTLADLRNKKESKI